MIWIAVMSVSAGAAILAARRAAGWARRRRARRRLLLDHARDSRQAVAERLAALGVWMHDLQDDTLHWSEGAFRVFGIEPEQGEPTPVAFLAALAPGDRERWREGVRKAIRHGDETLVEFRYRRADGRNAHVLAALRRETEGRRVARLSGIVQDVSTLRSMQRQLAAADARIFQLTRLGSASHLAIDGQSVFESGGAVAGYDGLTGMPNRASLLAALGQRLATAQPQAVLYLDLNGVDAINGSLGHDAGDRALATVADRIRSAIDPADMAARMGGDEFVVLLSQPLPRREIEEVARAIRLAIEQPLVLGERAWLLSVSIGVALAPHDACDAQRLLRCANSAASLLSEQVQ